MPTHVPCSLPDSAVDRTVDSYNRLRCLDGAERFLKPRVTFAELDGIAHAGLFRAIGLRRTPRRRLESSGRTTAWRGALPGGTR